MVSTKTWCMSAFEDRASVRHAQSRNSLGLFMNIIFIFFVNTCARAYIYIYIYIYNIYCTHTHTYIYIHISCMCIYIYIFMNALYCCIYLIFLSKISRSHCVELKDLQDGANASCELAIVLGGSVSCNLRKIHHEQW